MDGKQVVGQIDADNEDAVVRSLGERGLFPVAVAVKDVARQAGGRRVKARDLAVFYGQMADLLRTGVPMLRALETLARATPNEQMRSILRAIREEVASGNSLAEALLAQGKAFPSLHVAVVRAGERAGFLEDAMSNLSGFLERQDELRSKIIGALVYPVVLVVLMVLVVTILLVWAVPKFKPMFAGVEVPMATRLVFAASDLLRDHAAVLVGALAAGVGALVLAARSRGGRRLKDFLQLRTPLIGKTMRLLGITRFCRILGTMLHNGVPILQSLAISKDAAGIGALSDAIEKAAENVRAGDPLAEPLKRSGLFPPEVVEMIAIAEESNQLEKVLVQIADTVERRTNRQVDAAVRLIEPLILVVMAATIGFVAMGLLSPVFNMANAIN